MDNLFHFVGLVALLYLLISIAWGMGEIILYGQVEPRYIDGVVALILAVSIYFNIFYER